MGEKTEPSDGVDSNRLNDGWVVLGVGGTNSVRYELGSNRGVWIVKLAGFRLADLTGWKKGDGGADRSCSAVDSITAAVATAGREGWVGTLSERFLRLRPRRTGDVDRKEGTLRCCDSGLASEVAGDVQFLGGLSGSTRGFGYGKDIEEGDSGEELGDVSVPDGVSNVEMVVVGEDSVDSEGTDDDMLPRLSNDVDGGTAI